MICQSSYVARPTQTRQFIVTTAVFDASGLASEIDGVAYQQNPQIIGGGQLGFGHDHRTGFAF